MGRTGEAEKGGGHEPTDDLGPGIVRLRPSVDVEGRLVKEPVLLGGQEFEPRTYKGLDAVNRLIGRKDASLDLLAIAISDDSKSTVTVGLLPEALEDGTGVLLR